MKKIICDREKPILISGIIWVITYTICLSLLKNYSFNQFTGILIIIIPILTFAFFIYKYIKVKATMDEVEKRIHFEAVLIGFALSLVTLMSLGLFDLVVKLNHVVWGFRLLVYYFILFYFIGLVIAKKKYL